MSNVVKAMSGKSRLFQDVFSMTDKKLIDTLKKASESQDNIALKILLNIAAERIERHHAALFGTNPQ